MGRGKDHLRVNAYLSSYPMKLSLVLWGPNAQYSLLPVFDDCVRGVYNRSTIDFSEGRASVS